MKISIRLVLLCSFLAVIWGTFFLTTISSEIFSEKVLEEHAQVIMENISSYAMEQSQNYLSKAQRATELTKSLLRSRVLARENGDTLENYFLEQLRNYPDISGIYLGTPEGDFFFVSRNEKYSPAGIRTKIIHHENGQRQVHYRWHDQSRKLVKEEDDNADSYDPRQRPWYKGALKAAGIYWTDPYIFYTSQKPGITISGPTYTPSGQLKGIVGVDIEIDQLSTFIANLRIGTNGRAFMLDQNRDVVAFHDVDKIKFPATDGKSSSRLVKIDEFRDPLCRKAFSSLGIGTLAGSRILLNHAEHSLFDYEGKSYQAMFTPFPDPQWPWIIGMYMPEDDYLGALRGNRIDNYLKTFGISVFASFLILLVARSISRPVIGLRHYADNIAVGKFDRERNSNLAECRFKEISETVERFDGLLAALDRERQQRSEAEESLLRKEMQYASLVDNLKVGVFRIDRAGKIISANKAFALMANCANIIELKRYNVIGLYYDLDDRAALIDALKTQRSVETWEIQMRPIALKKPIWVSITGIVKREDGEAWVEGLIEDITERKHSEEMLIQAERMDAVGTMASDIAHEFNNIQSSVQNERPYEWRGAHRN